LKNCTDPPKLEGVFNWQEQIEDIGILLNWSMQDIIQLKVAEALHQDLQHLLLCNFQILLSFVSNNTNKLTRPRQLLLHPQHHQRALIHVAGAMSFSKVAKSSSSIDGKFRRHHEGELDVHLKGR